MVMYEHTTGEPPQLAVCSHDDRDYKAQDMITTVVASLLCAAFSFALSAVVVQCTQGPDARGRPTYEAAHWMYPAHAMFDNTAATYVTDYVITIAMCALALIIARIDTPSADVKRYAVLLLLTNGLSTLIGGMAHHAYSGAVQDLNSGLFYGMWCWVVGLTVVAGAWQGQLAAALLRRCPEDHWSSAPSRPGLFWAVWAASLVSLVLAGWLSHTRPACDIFVAGGMQAVPTGYLMLAVWRSCVQTKTLRLPPLDLTALLVSIVLNAPLIFIYPYLVRSCSLPVTNTILHAVLLVSWCGQGFGLRSILRADGTGKRKPE